MESYLCSCRYLSLIDYHKRSLVSSNVSPPRGFDMKNRPKPRIRPVDYHLECCIEAGFWKIASRGSYPQGQSVQFISPKHPKPCPREDLQGHQPSALEVLLFLPLMGQWTISGHLNLDVPDPLRLPLPPTHRTPYSSKAYLRDWLVICSDPALYDL